MLCVAQHHFESRPTFGMEGLNGYARGDAKNCIGYGDFTLASLRKGDGNYQSTDSSAGKPAPTTDVSAFSVGAGLPALNNDMSIGILAISVSLMRIDRCGPKCRRR